MKNNRLVSISFSTIDPGLPRVGNIQLLEMDIELFNEMSRTAFITSTIGAADAFWRQMKQGCLPNRLLAPKVELKPDALQAAHMAATEARDKLLADKYSLAAQVLAAEVNRLNAVLESRIKRDGERESEYLKMTKRLCKHEGHLPIYDKDKNAWCELCGTELE